MLSASFSDFQMLFHKLKASMFSLEHERYCIMIFLLETSCDDASDECV